MPQNNKCVKVKRRIGWSVGNKHTTDLCWPANTDALKESWAKITCSADIGIHPLQNTCLNHEYALPNKLFEYLNSGLVLITTELTEMKNELNQNKIGFCYSNSLELNEILKKLRLDKSLYDSILSNVSHYNLNNNYESEMEILEKYYLKLLA